MGWQSRVQERSAPVCWIRDLSEVAPAFQVLITNGGINGNQRQTRRPETRYSFEQFTAIRRYQPTLSFSPDGSEIAYVVNTSGQFNLWRQTSAGGFPHQLTLFSDQAVRDVAWSPDGKTIAFTADRDGDEFYQVYTIPARGGRLEALTDAPKVQHDMASRTPWSPDGSSLAYAGNDRKPDRPGRADPRHDDWRGAATGGLRRTVLPGQLVAGRQSR